MVRASDTRLAELEFEVDATLKSFERACSVAEAGVRREVSDLQRFAHGLDKQKMGAYQRTVFRALNLADAERLHQFAYYDIRGSFLVVIRAVIERSLNEIADSFYKKQLNWPLDVPDIRLSPNELKGNGVVRACLFLKKVVNLQLPLFFSRELLLIDDLRNAFAHHYGVIDKGLKNRLEKHKENLSSDSVNPLLDFKIEVYDEERYVIRLGHSLIKGLVNKTILSFQELFDKIREFQPKNEDSR